MLDITEDSNVLQCDGTDGFFQVNSPNGGYLGPCTYVYNYICIPDVLSFSAVLSSNICDCMVGIRS